MHSQAQACLPLCVSTDLVGRFKHKRQCLSGLRAVAQMGGAEGVYRAEVMTGPLTVEGGLYMHCIPRVPSTAQPATELRS